VRRYARRGKAPGEVAWSQVSFRPVSLSIRSLETILVKGAILPLFVPTSDTSQSYCASYRIGTNSTGDLRFMRCIMVENYQSADLYLERAADYEQGVFVGATRWQLHLQNP
jgi:hypothetical protein